MADLGILQPIKNVGSSSSIRATEPQVPEGKVVFALYLFKASAAPEGSKEKKI